jgi:hypothetical protein
MAEHSPAPWHTGTDEDAHIVYDANADFVANVRRYDDPELEVANAHLVTAAPELLAACQRFLDAHQAAMNGIGMQGKPCQCGPCVEARVAVAETKGGG